MIKIVTLVFLFVPLILSQSCTYYIASTGNDNNSGDSPNSPWATLDKVNSVKKSNGEIYCFRSEDSFRGSLIIDGDQLSSLTFQTYGGINKVNIITDDPKQNGIYLYCGSNILIQNFNIVGPGPLVSENNGVFLYAGELSSNKYGPIKLQNLEVSGFIFGVMVGSVGVVNNTNYYCGYKDVLIENTIAHDNRNCGIFTYGTYTSPPNGIMSHKNIVVRNCTAYNNKGNPNDKTQHSGSGIILSGTDGGLIEYSVAHHNGELNAHENGGPYGIWVYYANAVIIQKNIAYSNSNGGTNTDGGGFDIDGGATNCILQYNYSFDNEGPGYLLCQFEGASTQSNNTIRYNIGQNDAITNSIGAIFIYSTPSSGGVQNGYIYGNTIYVNKRFRDTSPVPLKIQSSNYSPIKNIQIYNNIFIGFNSLINFESTMDKDFILTGNSYWSTNNWSINWGGKVFTTLDSFRSATGLETFQGMKTGFSTKPDLLNAGEGCDCEDPFSMQEQLSQAYSLVKNSPLGNGGIPKSYLESLRAGVDPGESDFFGNELPNTKLSVGAYQSS